MTLQTSIKGRAFPDTFGRRLKKDMRRNGSMYLLMIPVLLFYLYFCYKPIYGILMAFQDFNLRRGIMGSEWIGLENFRRFFNDVYFSRNIINTVRISFASIVFGFPIPIILALLINEMASKKLAKAVQTISYIPHFISLVVICSMVKNFVATDGIITQIVNMLTGTTAQESLLNDAGKFVPIYVLSDIWQQAGWNSIIYIAALASVDHQLCEAAVIDGAGRLKQVIHVVIPSILPTIIIMFILRLGTVLSVGYEKIILLTNAYNAETSEVLSYYIYKRGIAGGEYGLATAAGVFNSVINCIFVVAANYLSRVIGETSLW